MNGRSRAAAAVAALALLLPPAAPAPARDAPPGGEATERIEATRHEIRLPEGFRIALYALAPGARHMAVAPAAGGGSAVVFVGTRTDRVWAVLDRDGDGRAEEVRTFAPGLRFRGPNGPCLDASGTLFVPEANRMRAFPDAAARLGEDAPAAAEVVPEGALVPEDELVPLPGWALPSHAWRVCREVYARGVRNSVGLAFRPGTDELWFTDTDPNGLGDDLPPGEVNRADGPGQHFGFPWYAGGRVRIPEYLGGEPPPGAVFPVVETTPHATDLGLVFYEGSMFPAAYRGALFSAQRGSSVRSAAVGARVMVTFLSPDGSAREHRPFAEGWLDATTGRYRGRIADVAMLPDGSLLVSDDEAGALYRITYHGPH